MKRATLIVFILVLWLATCSAPEPNMIEPIPAAATQTSIPATETTAHIDTLSATPPAPTEETVPQGKLPAPPFPAKLYVSKNGTFALDYPDGWTVSETVVGDRGTQIQFLSNPDLADAAVIPEGETRVNATIYQWDPKNDLDAYVAQRKSAWEASGFTIVEEQPLTLELGLPAVLFTIQTPDAQSVFLLTALNDNYLEISGEGDLELVKTIAQRLRPLSQ